jgi:hypothetical protein
VAAHPGELASTGRNAIPLAVRCATVVSATRQLKVPRWGSAADQLNPVRTVSTPASGIC